MSGDPRERLVAPGVAAYMEVLVSIEALVLGNCPAWVRPSGLRADQILGLAEALADAAREASATEAGVEPSECGGCESRIYPDCRPATAPRTPLTPLRNAAERLAGVRGTSDHPRPTDGVRGRT